MQVQVEDVGPCKKLVKIELPAERVDEELEKTYAQLNDGATVPGFRRGHVPRWLLRSRFGEQVDTDTKETLVSDSFEEAVKGQNLRPIGAPQFDEEITFEAGKPLSFGVTIEVRPEFDIGDYSGLELKKPSTKATKAEIQERVDHVRRRYATLEDVTEGAPEEQDIATGRLVLQDGGEVYREIPEHQVIAGDHVFVGMTPEETTEFLAGIEIGKSAEKKITIPDAFPDEAKRGAKMTLSFELTALRRPILPKVTAAWVKEIGFDSLDEFHEEIETAVGREKDRGAQDDLERQLIEQLLKKVDFELPEDVIKSMAERTLIRRSLDLRQRGMPPEEMEKQLDTMRAESEKSAHDAAKTFFILEEVADKERVFVTEEEVQARVEAIAANYGRSPDQVLRDLERDDRVSELRNSMREEKVKALLLEKATIKEAKRAAPKAKAKAKSKKASE